MRTQRALIERAFSDGIEAVDRDALKAAVDDTIDRLDRGELRVSDPPA
jgi:hypothetical protein